MNIETARKTLGLEVKLIAFKDILAWCDAMWTYRGFDGEPHALLTSGNHSDGYINLNAVLQFPNLCAALAKDLTEALEEHGITTGNVDAVVSSSFAALTLGQAMARQLKAMFVFTEKKDKEQKWTGRFELPKGTRILQVEELITTLGTTRKVREAVLNSNSQVEFIKLDGKIVVATVFYRPDDLARTEPDYQIIPLIQKEIHNWSPEECPLCKKGSLALKPKPNWQRFLEYQRRFHGL